KEIKKKQFAKLKKIVSYAYKHSRFYKDHYDLHEFHPSQLLTFDDINKIPIVRRHQLKDCPSEQLLTVRNHRNLHCHTTSGSSGIPVNIYYNRIENYKVLWSCLRSYLHAGMSLRDRTVALRDPIDIKKNTFYQKMGIIPYDYFNLYDSIENIYANLLKNYSNIDILKAYPTDLVNLALLSNKDSRSFPKVKYIYSDSEVLDSFSRNFIEKSLGTKILDFYASVECGMIAFQTPTSNGKYLVNEDMIILEDLGCNSSDSASPILITNLYKMTTPIIRYELGDIIEFDRDSQNDENGVLRLNRIHGKYLDFIVLSDNSIVSPHVPKQDLTHLGCIDKFKLVQEKIDSVTLTIQKGAGFNDTTELEILRKMDIAFKGLIKTRIEYVQDLVRGDCRKFKVIESKVAQKFLSH
ncbi:phenylacetate--CoA ligase family protein, partial [Vibrio cholerae]